MQHVFYLKKLFLCKQTCACLSVHVHIYDGVPNEKSVPKYRILSKIFSFKPLFLVFHYLYEVAAYFLFIKNKNQLKWKNEIYHQKYALAADDLLLGARNGN